MTQRLAGLYKHKQKKYHDTDAGWNSVRPCVIKQYPKKWAWISSFESFLCHPNRLLFQNLECVQISRLKYPIRHLNTVVFLFRHSIFNQRKKITTNGGAIPGEEQNRSFNLID